MTIRRGAALALLVSLSLGEASADRIRILEEPREASQARSIDRSPAAAVWVSDEWVPLGTS